MNELQQLIEMQLRMAGLYGSGSNRFDANETAIFSRQLEHIMAKTYDVEYPEYKGRSLFRISGEVHNGAEKWTYRQLDGVGRMKMLSTFGAKDFPTVTVKGEEVSGKAGSFGGAYDYTLQDMRAAAMAGLPLETMKAQAVRRAFEVQLDELIAVGDGGEIKGITNADNISTFTTSDVTGDWQDTGTDFSEIVADTRKMVLKIQNDTLNVRGENLQLLLPNKVYNSIRHRLIDPNAVYQQKTILQGLLELFPEIKRITYWPQLNLLAESNAKGLSMLVDMSPDNVSIELPQDFEQFPPQLDGLTWRVLCHGRFAGAKVPYPKGVLSIEGLDSGA